MNEIAEYPDWAARDDVPWDWIPGIAIRGFGKYVEIDPLDRSTPFLATIRGALKRDQSSSDPVAVGDRVWVTRAQDGEGRVERVSPRTSQLARPSRRAEVSEQIVLANPDQALFLFSVAQPKPHIRLLDRFLILAEHSGLPARVVVNKTDLDEQLHRKGEPGSRELFRHYEPLYPTHYVSVMDGSGIPELEHALEGNVSVLAGPSGAGKSSLVNVLKPDQVRATGNVSHSTDKGKHTTSTSELLRLGPTTFIADTPGIKSLAVSNIDATRLDSYFPEFRPYLGDCKYADCFHLSEPACAIRQAVSDGTISPARYDSYARLRS